MKKKGRRRKYVEVVDSKCAGVSYEAQRPLALHTTIEVLEWEVAIKKDGS